MDVVDYSLAADDRRRGIIDERPYGLANRDCEGYLDPQLYLQRALEHPNLPILNDRIDLDDRTSATFQACEFLSPVQIDSAVALHQAIRGHATGLALLSTTFKFQGSRWAVPGSKNWILLVDACHRTQELQLGAFPRATFPNARFFGFNSTRRGSTSSTTSGSRMRRRGWSRRSRSGG